MSNKGTLEPESVFAVPEGAPPQAAEGGDGPNPEPHCRVAQRRRKVLQASPEPPDACAQWRKKEGKRRREGAQTGR